ncbi:hypothetical protein ONS96_001477 [Cadophora gregata f. sp. sojae]|nr:hypothetical protein ONS96_001477 [Cadophora gregata f. sp. sojae]
MGSRIVRHYGSQAAERKVYDAPNESLLVDDVLNSVGKSDGPGALEYHLERATTERNNKHILDEDLKKAVDDRCPADVQIQGVTEDWVAGQGERQDGNSIHLANPDDGTASTTMEDGELLEGETSCVQFIDSESTSSATAWKSGAQDEWREPDEEPDAENREGFQEYESDLVETREDADLLRASNRRALIKGVCFEELRAHVDPALQPDAEEEPVNRTIHILGLGAAGKYIAHSLAGLPFPPPITLLMHRPLMMQHWHDEGAAINVIKGGRIKTQSNFHIESSADFVREDSGQKFPGFGPRLEHTSEPPNYPIDALIVTTEAYRTVSALTAIKHRLGRSSTIFILNNGLGLVERINEKVFPDSKTRPTYILGNMSHKLESTELHFTLIEKNPGRLECSKFPHVSVSRRETYGPTLTRKDFSWTAPASHLVGSLARTPEFSTFAVGHKSFYESQLQNLAAGAVIGPLSVAFDCTNDLLLYNYSASQAMKLLLREISRVIRSLPEMQSLPNLEQTFSARRLEAIVVSRISKTGKNYSAMLQSVRAGNKTDIDYYNGYIERRARELGIDTPRNQMMLYLVKGKSAARSRELNNYIPFEDDY